MIWEFLVDILFGGVTWLLSVLPDYTAAAASESTALQYVVSSARFLDNWFNLPVLLGVLGLWATLEAAAMTAQLVQWVYGKIPGKAT